MSKESFIRGMVMELSSRYKNNNKKRMSELNKIMKFVKSSDYFKGKKRDLYKIIINAKNKK